MFVIEFVSTFFKLFTKTKISLRVTVTLREQTIKPVQIFFLILLRRIDKDSILTLKLTHPGLSIGLEKIQGFHLSSLFCTFSLRRSTEDSTRLHLSLIWYLNLVYYNEFWLCYNQRGHFLLMTLKPCSRYSEAVHQ